MEENEKKTSILYQIGNYKIEYDFIHEYGKMCSIFNKGPEAVKEYLVSIWTDTRESLMGREDLKVLDIDRVISKDDFNITFNMSSKKEPIFFITFPDYNNNIAESKCIAFSITNDRPRFFAMEHRVAFEGTSDDYIFGEFEFSYTGNNFKHTNYGLLERNTVENFATRVLDMIEH